MPSLFERLDKWQQQLPAPLAIQTSANLPVLCDGEEGRRIGRFNLTLTLRSLQIRLLVYRPLLLNRLSGEVPLWRLRSDLCQCLEIAEEIISIQHALALMPYLGYELNPTWWVTIYSSTYSRLCALRCLTLS